jgi:hypothetical protein
MFLCSREEFSKCATSNQNKIPLREIGSEVNDAADLRKAMGI